MKDFRVLITEKCNADCPSCFNKNIRCGNEMSLENFKKLCDYLSAEGDIKRLKIMGGEPTVHPNFSECMKYAQSKFYGIHIFTNAINEKIETINLREKDSVIYNVSCLPVHIHRSRYMLEQKGGRMFETQLSSETDINHIKTVLYEARCIIPDNRMSVALTLNCIENIFENKEKIIALWNDISDFLFNELKLEHNIDHNIPYCFFIGSNMNIRVKNSLCSTKCAGLITLTLKLQYCNQSQDVLENIIVDDKLIPFEIIENRLSEYYHKKMLLNSEKICRNCVFFEKKCNGGCFIHKSIISKESVLAKTDLPIL